MNITENEFCSGCTACEQKCPAKAIVIMPDQNGFLSAKVDNRKCIHCGVCLSVCPMRNADKVKHEIIKPYAAINNDEVVFNVIQLRLFHLLYSGFLFQKPLS